MYSDMTLQLAVVAEAGLAQITFISLRSGLPLTDLGHGQLQLLQVLQLLDCSALDQREVGEGEGGVGEWEGGHQTSHGDTQWIDHCRLQLWSECRSDCERGLLLQSEAGLG